MKIEIVEDEIYNPQSYDRTYNFEFTETNKRLYNKVLRQLMNVWNNVYIVLKDLITDDAYIFIEKLYNIYFIQHKLMIDYYSVNNARLRMHKQYKIRKLNKLRNRIPQNS